MIFSKQEINRRRAAFEAALSERNVDVALLHTADSAYYVSGAFFDTAFGRAMWAVVLPGKESALLGPAMDYEAMLDNTTFETVRYYDDTLKDPMFTMMKDYLQSQKMAPRRLGIERRYMMLGLYEEICAAFPDAELVEIGDILDELRIIKSPEEILLLTVCADTAKVGNRAFMTALQENVTELEVATAAWAGMVGSLAALYPQSQEQGYGGLGKPSYVFCQTGRHTLSPHCNPTTRRIHQGDIVNMTLAPTVWGYGYGIERAFVFGQPNAEQKHVLEAVTEASYAGIRAMKPGRTFAEVDKIAKDVLRHYGYTDEDMRHGTGHSCGTRIGPAGRQPGGELRPHNTNEIKPNMVLTVEPGVYLPHLGGFRHCDTMVITEDGNRILTEMPWDISDCFREDLRNFYQKE